MSDRRHAPSRPPLRAKPRTEAIRREAVEALAAALAVATLAVATLTRWWRPLSSIVAACTRNGLHLTLHLVKFLLKFYGFTFSEVVVAILEALHVDKDILAAIVRGNEAETAVSIPLLDDAGWHLCCAMKKTGRRVLGLMG